MSVSVQATTDNWQREDVDWRAGGGRRIKGIYVPKDSPFPTASGQPSRPLTALAESKNASAGIGATAAPLGNQIDSPPVSGFIVNIAVAVTDAKSADDFDWTAQYEPSIAGGFLTSHPDTDFAVGILDTGASFHLLSHAAAEQTGIFAANLLTSSTVDLIGATGSVSVWVSQPLAIFIDGLSAVDPNTLTVNHSNMTGQSNVVACVGQVPEGNTPDLPTAIGTPLSAYLAAAIFNDRQVSLIRDGTEYSGPDVKFYDLADPCIPQYDNSAALNLIPAGGYDVEYFPDLDSLMDLILQPGSPSIIVGNSAQSVFFFDSVDLYKGTHSSLDKHRFLLDTGSQVTVISTAVGARLGLKPSAPDFKVEIQDVTGEITIQPGFFIDTLDIPALGDWLTYTHVPVIMLNIDSPEGGYVDGILGMNLFVEFDLVVRGGGLFGQDSPSLDFKRIALPPVGDIAPLSTDGRVDFRDLSALANAWLSSEGTANWNPRADLFPRQVPDGIVNNADFAVLAAHWRETTPSQMPDAN